MLVDINNGHVLVGDDTIYEYRSEVDSSTGITYEGWTEVRAGGTSISLEVWRLAKTTETTVGTVTTKTVIYAGSGGFDFAWDNRTTAFSDVGQQNKVFMDDNNYIFQDGNNYIFKEE